MEAHNATTEALYTLTEGTEFELDGNKWSVISNDALESDKGRYVKVKGVETPFVRTFYRTTGGLHPRALSDEKQVFVTVE